MEDDSIELTKLNKENAHVYNLPPISTSIGHTVDDFQELIFRGDMKITIKGELCIVYFLNPDKTVFLISIINSDIDQFIKPASGSTRYYTLLAMTPEGKQSIYGVVFKQRNDAFDFHATIVQFKEKLEFEKKISTQIDYKPKYNFNQNIEDEFQDDNQQETKEKSSFQISSAPIKEKEGGTKKFKFGNPNK